MGLPSRPASGAEGGSRPSRAPYTTPPGRGTVARCRWFARAGAGPHPCARRGVRLAAMTNRHPSIASTLGFALALALAACSITIGGSDEPRATPVDGPASPASDPTDAPPAGTVAAPGRLAVVGVDGR